MDPFLRYAKQQQTGLTGLIQTMVECESPSGDARALARFVDLMAEHTRGEARVKKLAGGHARFEFRLPRSRKEGPSGALLQRAGHIMALGHVDTVWPIGSLRTMPYKQARGRLWGPGVFDMKSGLALFIFAMRALRDLDVLMRRDVVLQVNADEETGSATSRSFTEEAARGAAAVLVLEPAAGLDGRVKTERKGIGDYVVTVRGQSAHAGLDFAAGANAIVEAARQIGYIADITRLERGITVSPGVVRGGTMTNVVPDECRIEVDVRVPRAADARYLERAFAKLKPHDKRCRIEVTGGLNRPPLERTAAVRGLYRKARAIAADLGVELGEASVGGGSDGNFTAALGVPTLDGLGAVGEGAHAAHESVLINRLADRVALLARLVAEL